MNSAQPSYIKFALNANSVRKPARKRIQFKIVGADDRKNFQPQSKPVKSTKVSNIMINQLINKHNSSAASSLQNSFINENKKVKKNSIDIKHKYQVPLLPSSKEKLTRKESLVGGKTEMDKVEKELNNIKVNCKDLAKAREVFEVDF